jgi:hypothetical protein
MWIALAIVAVVFLAIVCLPLGVEVSSGEGTRRWFLILAGIHFPIPDAVIRRILKRIGSQQSGRVKKERKTEPSDLGGESGSLPSRRGFLSREFKLDDWRTILELVIRLLRTLRIRIHRLHVVIATPDPALTGVVYGMTCAVIGALPADWPVSVEADWSGSAPKAKYRIEASVIPIRVLSVFARIFWKKVRR